MRIFFGLFLIFSIVSCYGDIKTDSNPPSVDVYESPEEVIEENIPVAEAEYVAKVYQGKTATEVYQQIVANIEEKEPINVMTEINHGEAARDVGIQLDENRLIVFGNPMVGTKLMQQNQLAGLDLPMKMLVYEYQDQTYTIYHDASTLSQRYGIKLPQVEEKVNAALQSLSANDVKKSISPQKSDNVTALIETKTSGLDIDLTSESLEQELKRKGLQLTKIIDHQKNAESVGLKLRPTRLFIFGNPNVGSQLMKANPAIGLDLPLKILVWEDENGETKVSYFNGSVLLRRYKIENKELGDKIDEMLSSISTAALN